MKNSIALVRVFGIVIKAEFTWFVAFGFLFWSLGSHYFPAAYPELSTLDAWTLALAVTAFLYVSIAAHELGHGIVSNTLGTPVQTITLFLFGGLAHLAREPRRARDEFMIALAGPIVSLVLALGFASLYWIGDNTIGIKAAAFGLWLGRANFLLAIFNLIPGFPLDGGRVFRAILWGFIGNFQRSTRIASRLGQAVALGLMTWGGLQFLDGGIANGLWIAFIGWFLFGMATRSLANLNFIEKLEGLTARDIMISDCTFVSPSWTLDRWVHKMGSSDGSNFSAVVGNDRVTGIIRMRDVEVISEDSWSSTTVGIVMRRFDELHTVSPDARAQEVLQQMAELNLAQIPVIEGEAWLGMITHEGIRAIRKLLSEPRTRSETR